MEKQNNHLVIMAGGVGSRFWPMSSEQRPKQFIDILGCGKTLIQLTVERFGDLVPKSNVWVVTSAAYADIVAEQLPDVPRENILLEPCRRNTAPCVCYVSWKIKKRNPRANVVVAPSDHIVTDEATFRKTIKEALEFTSETDAIVTLGMKPSRPETGYGYIKADLSYPSSRKRNLYRVDSFKEKPSLDVATQYVQQPNYLWNSGIFVWSIRTIINAFRVYQPKMSRDFEKLLPLFDTEQEQEAIDKLYATCESISVDYAIMEHAEEIFVYPASFGWSDLGTWSSLLMQSPRDEHGNAAIGADIRLFDTHNCIVHTTEARQVVVQGLDGFIVAEQDGQLLICKLSEEQRIKLFHD
ncbi:MAG: mannose-1-phosphate guanylyltransferase [Bacteroidaceae bacterium]|jgi:mannose-1-phosphate guanylyltransferase|nr:mannose-1-phosphate guanylyltransferase [Bacteroidaceae bacterium]